MAVWTSGCHLPELCGVGLDGDMEYGYPVLQFFDARGFVLERAMSSFLLLRKCSIECCVSYRCLDIRSGACGDGMPDEQVYTCVGRPLRGV